MIMLLPNVDLLNNIFPIYRIKSEKLTFVNLVTYADMQQYTKYMIDDIISQYLDWCDVTNKANDFELIIRDKAHSIELTDPTNFYLLDNKLNLLFDRYDELVTTVLTEQILSIINQHGRNCVPILTFVANGTAMITIN